MQHLTIPELTSPPREFGLPLASFDPDAADAGGVAMSLVAGSESAGCEDMFSVATNGQVTLISAALAYGSANCTFDVRVTDSASLSSLPEQVTVEYVVACTVGTVAHVRSHMPVATHRFADTNNFPDVTPQAVSIPEDTAAGTVILPSIGATDLDGDTLTYTIVKALGFSVDSQGGPDNQRDLTALSIFVVDRDTSAISLSPAAQLNFEVDHRYVLTVEVEDDGAGRLQSFVDVTISASDVNESPLLTVPVQIPAVPESTAAGTLVFTATASDEDSGDVLVFSLTSDVASLPFSINAESGAVTVAAPLNYEAASQYTMTVVATDGAGLIAEASVSVDIGNENEKAAVAPLSLSVPEDTVVGSVLASVDVSDPDGSAGSVTFAVTGGTGGALFTVSTGGQIALSSPLDYETITAYDLEITVTDRLDGDSTDFVNVLSVTVEVTNVNDVTLTSVAVSEGQPGVSTQALSTSGGEQLDLHGSDFGGVGSVIIATYGPDGDTTRYEAQACAVVQHNALIRCTSAEGVGGTGMQWTLTVNGDTAPVTSSAATSVGYGVPVVTATSAAAVPTTGGTQGASVVTLSGSNFGPPSTIVDEVLYGQTALYDPTPRCAVVSHDTIRCGTVAGAGRQHQWRVTIGGQVSHWSAMTATTNYAAPTIEALTVVGDAELGALHTAGGQSIVVRGSNLGPGVTASATSAQNSLASVSASYGNTGGGFVEAFFETSCTVTVPHMEATCVTTEGVGGDLRLFVAVGGQGSAASPTGLSYAHPAISGVGGKGAVGASTKGGEVVVVAGSNLGPSFTAGRDVVTYGPTGTEFVATDCTTAEKHTQLSCVTAPGTGAGHKWQVTIASQASPVHLPTMLDGTTGTRYAPPIISFFSGEGASSGTEGGEVVTVHGHNFGTDSSLITDVRYSQTDKPDVVFATTCTIVEDHVTLSCATVPGAGTNLEWRLSVDGQASTTALTQYNVPTVTAVSLASSASLAHPDGGEAVVITGSDFGPAPANDDDPVFVRADAVTYGPTGVEYACANVVHISHTELRCTTVPSFGDDLRFRVVVGTQESPVTEAGVGLSFRRPAIVSLEPATAGANAEAAVVVHTNNLPLLDPTAVVVVEFGNLQDGSRSSVPLQVFGKYPTIGAGDGSYTPRTTPQRVSFTLPHGVGLGRGVTLAVYRVGAGVSSAVRSETAVFDYLPPSLDYVFVNRTGTVVELQVHGANFGDDLPDLVKRDVLVQVFTPEGVVDAGVNGGEFSANGVTLVSWADDLIVVRTGTAFGRLKVIVSSLPHASSVSAGTAEDGDWDVQVCWLRVLCRCSCQTHAQWCVAGDARVLLRRCLAAHLQPRGTGVVGLQHGRLHCRRRCWCRTQPPCAFRTGYQP